MTDTLENMVLRTLYLPLETDRQLKALAFTRDISKGELIRELIKQGLVTIAASGERSLAEQVSARFTQTQPVATEKKARGVAKPTAARSREGAAGSRHKARDLVAAD